jgi:hypothetical protein
MSPRKVVAPQAAALPGELLGRVVTILEDLWARLLGHQPQRDLDAT